MIKFYECYTTAADESNRKDFCLEVWGENSDYTPLLFYFSDYKGHSIYDWLMWCANEVIDTGATKEILDITFKALKDTDTEIAKRVQPLEQVIDIIKEKMRTHHIRRMQQGLCTIEAGFVWSDLLTDLERVSDHCSNIAGCLIDASIMHNLSIHETQRIAEDSSSDYGKLFKDYSKKYSFSNI